MRLERRTGEELADRRQRGRHALAPGGRRRCRGHWVHAGEGVCNGGCRRRVGCVRADVCAAGRIRQPGYAGPARAAARLYTPAGGPRAISASVAQMGARDETIAAGAPPSTDPRGPARGRHAAPPGEARARHGAHHAAAHCRAARRAPMGLAHGCCAHTSCAHTLSYARADRPCRPRMTSRASRLSAPRIRRGRSRRVHPRAGARHAPLAASRRVPTPGPPRIYARAARRPRRRTAVSSTPHSQASRRGRGRGAWQRSAPTKGLPARPSRAQGDPVSHDACAADLAGDFAR
jgi:hypothetical protein